MRSVDIIEILWIYAFIEQHS